ncbi:MAG: FHA domain-containing protein, partial [bacterium]
MIEHWLVSTTPGQNARFRLQPPGPLRVGRSAGNEIVLDDRTISRNHAVLEWIPPGEGAEGRWRLINTSTTGATAVNNVRMSAGIGLTLAPGDLL